MNFDQVADELYALRQRSPPQPATKPPAAPRPSGKPSSAAGSPRAAPAHPTKPAPAARAPRVLRLLSWRVECRGWMAG